MGLDIDDDGESTELLTHIVSLWLTIRGFSLSKTWMEDYKAATATNTKKKKRTSTERSRSQNI